MVFCISPVGRAWAAATTEGLLIYSLDHNLVFDPFELDLDITPQNVKVTLGKGEYSTALMLSFRLNEQALIQEVLENTPVADGKVWIYNFTYGELKHIRGDNSLKTVLSPSEKGSTLDRKNLFPRDFDNILIKF